MVNQDIDISKEGIKIPYRLFLSDSSAGYAVILIGIFSYYYPIFGKTLQEIFPSLNSISISPEVKIFAFFLLFLLSTPLGLAINVTSFVILGPLLNWSEIRWFNVKNRFFRYLIDSTKKKLFFDDCKTFYNLDENKWYRTSILIGETLSISHPEVAESLDQIQGIYIFLRNIAFLLISIILINCYILLYDIKHLLIIVLILVLLIILIILISVIAFYYHLFILLKGYFLCRDNKKQECDVEKIITCLAKKSK